MKFSNLEIKPNYGAKPGEFPYQGTLSLIGGLGYGSVNLSEQTIKAILALTAVDASALFRGAALQATSELGDLADVTTDAPALAGEWNPAHQIFSED
jgi:hypothetical protein